MKTGLVGVFHLISEVVNRLLVIFKVEIEQKGSRIGFASTSKGFSPLTQSQKFFGCVSILTYFCFCSMFFKLLNAYSSYGKREN